MHVASFDYKASDLEFQHAADYLAKITKCEWEAKDGALKITTKVDAATWQAGEKVFRDMLQPALAIGVQSFSVHGTHKNAPAGKVTVISSLSDAKDIITLAKANVKMGQQIVQGVTSPSSELPAIDAATLATAREYLNRTSGYQWAIEGNTLTCDTEVAVPPSQKYTWEAGQAIFCDKMKETVGLEIDAYAQLRNVVPPFVKVTAKITDAGQIERLAELNHPQIILRDDKGYPRSLTSVAATLCVLIPEGYSKKQLENAGAAPERTLAFPYITISSKGLIIKLPIELAEDSRYVDSLQDLTQKEAVSIDERHFKRQFKAQITIPLEGVCSFIEDTLGLQKVTYPDQKQVSIIDDLIAANKKVLSDASRKKLKAKPVQHKT